MTKNRIALMSSAVVLAAISMDDTQIIKRIKVEISRNLFMMVPFMGKG